jgi:hypothetical protein
MFHLPTSSWQRARVAYAGARPFTWNETREEMQAYHCLLADQQNKMEDECKRIDDEKKRMGGDKKKALTSQVSDTQKFVPPFLKIHHWRRWCSQASISTAPHQRSRSVIHGALIENIKFLLKGFTDFSIKHVCRSHNRIAHFVADEGCENKCNKSWSRCTTRLHCKLIGIKVYVCG